MRGYNDDLVMSFSMGLWIRETALRLRAEGIELQKTAITNSNFIDQCLVYGDNKPYLVALIVLNSQINISKDDLSVEIENINKNLTKIEKIKKFFVVKENFSIENGMMTPTLKLKRYKINKLYKKNFEELYNN